MHRTFESNNLPHIVFSSGGGAFGAFTGGLQEAAAFSGEAAPDVYVATSAGLPNSLARVVAEYRIIDENKRRLENGNEILSTQERGQIVHDCHVHLWAMIEKDYQAFRPMFDVDVMKNFRFGDAVAMRMAKAQASIVNMFGNAGPMFDPFGMGRFWQQAGHAVTEDYHPWAQYMRRIFPDVDKALAHPDTPRVIALAYDFASGEEISFDSRPVRGRGATLGQLVSTMVIPNNTGTMPLVHGRYGDGAFTGFNGDNFHILQKLVAENSDYAFARITWVDLGMPDIISPAAMKGINPLYAANRDHGQRMWHEVGAMFPHRHFELCRKKWGKSKLKFEPEPGTITALREEGREAYEKHHMFLPPTDHAKLDQIAARLALMADPVRTTSHVAAIKRVLAS